MIGFPQDKLGSDGKENAKGEKDFSCYDGNIYLRMIVHRSCLLEMYNNKERFALSEKFYQKIKGDTRESVEIC